MMKRNVLIALTFLAIALIASDSFAVPVKFSGHSVVADLPEAMLLVCIGIGIGMVGTLIGAGGGFLVVPILLLFYNFSPQHAIGTSITVVFMNALSGTFSYMSQKKIDYEIGLKFSVIAVPGVLIGAASAQLFSMFSFSIIFGLFLLILSYGLFSGMQLNLSRVNGVYRSEERTIQDITGQVYKYTPDMEVGLFSSFFVGIISGLFGIGGGIIHVPLMYSVLGVPVHIATAISHYILAITSFFGMLSFIGWNEVDLDYAVFLGAGAILGAYIGAKFSLKTKPQVIKNMIALCLLMLAVKLLVSVL